MQAWRLADIERKLVKTRLLDPEDYAALEELFRTKTFQNRARAALELAA